MTSPKLVSSINQQHSARELLAESPLILAVSIFWTNLKKISQI